MCLELVRIPVVYKTEDREIEDYDTEKRVEFMSAQEKYEHDYWYVHDRKRLSYAYLKIEEITSIQAMKNNHCTVHTDGLQYLVPMSADKLVEKLEPTIDVLDVMD